jgi:hypothetical protein
MKPTEERLMTKEAIVARLLAIGSKPKLKPPPTAEQKAREVWKPPLETVLTANRQSNQLALERAEQEQEEAQRLRQREQFIRNAQIANETAVELGYFQRRMEALADRRWDPTGIWGRPNYKQHPDD